MGRKQCIISIHAPAWGATVYGILAAPPCTISIHAPAWGATDYSMVIQEMESISIHAPAWGATLYKLVEFVEFFQFQSTHPRGVRPLCVSSIRFWGGFQSTHPRGVRPGGTTGILNSIKISIHAPAWGATAKMHKIIYKKETRCVKTLSISFSLSLPQIK